ncbi:WD40-repeat-containing domain protein [Biscogniauxia mediterranea]|nr:WD40-repeat-containing domain protein [Biscogniauxia mediterranea]
MPTSSPDRFVPFNVAVPDRFRANKQPHELSPSERLLRTDEAGSDAFCFSPKSATPTASRRVSRSEGLERRLSTVLDLNSLERQVSNGAVWSVGGLAPMSGGSASAVDDGGGRLVSSGTNARLYTTSFSNRRPKSEEDQEKHEGRLALALKIDRVQRVLDFDGYSTFPRCRSKGRPSLQTSKTTWTGTEVLDAPGLRDDFYCSIMAYSKTCNTLAVGLGNLLYGWSESSGVTLLNSGTKDGSWLTSVAFSSNQGRKSILAFGRSNGSLSLMSLFDSLIPRFEAQQPAPVACLSWRPTVTKRPSLNIHSNGVLVETEDLLVGDEMGDIYYYSVHSQQICGLAWSLNGLQFATGGNDNMCCLFDVDKIIDTESGMAIAETHAKSCSTATETSADESSSSWCSAKSSDGVSSPALDHGSARPAVRQLPTGSERHRWRHAAAVKAIAFCPWREGLIATGGGSNDKCIHFYHTTSGAALATISVSAQVTSLIWSTTRREIAATFGYAQPDHPYRIAVFSWPDCRQVAARLRSRTAEEGCIVVAGSDESVKFHEVWMAGRKATALGSGILAGSDILEMAEGIDKEGEVIR